MTMMIESTLEELLNGDEHDPGCEILVKREGRLEEKCGQRARWIGSTVCPHGCAEQFLACDYCHDLFASQGDTWLSETGPRPITWRPL